MPTGPISLLRSLMGLRGHSTEQFLSFIMKLPDDVILHIWTRISDYISSHSISSDAWSDPRCIEVLKRSRTPFRLAQVCRAWRGLALATPSLWTNIYVNGFDRKLEKLKMQLKRSQNAPLVIHFHYRPRTEVLDLLAPQVHRWQRLTFDTGTYDKVLATIVHFYANYPEHKAKHSILVAIEITAPFRFGFTPDYHFFDLETILPNLTSFSLNLCRITPYSNLIPSSIRKVSLTSRPIKWRQLNDLARTCPNIESLTIRSESSDQEERVGQQYVAFASLRELETDSSMAIELCLPAAPNLRTLKLSCAHRFDRVLRFGNHQLNSLTRLEISLSWCRAAAVHRSILSLLSVTPRLQSLLLSDTKRRFERDPINCDFILSKACEIGVWDSLKELGVHYLAFNLGLLSELANKMTTNFIDGSPQIIVVGSSSVSSLPRLQYVGHLMTLNHELREAMATEHPTSCSMEVNR